MVLTSNLQPVVSLISTLTSICPWPLTYSLLYHLYKHWPICVLDLWPYIILYHLYWHAPLYDLDLRLYILLYHLHKHWSLFDIDLWPTVCGIININFDIFMSLTSDLTSLCITYIDMQLYMTLTSDCTSFISTVISIYDVDLWLYIFLYQYIKFNRTMILTCYLTVLSAGTVISILESSRFMASLASSLVFSIHSRSLGVRRWPFLNTVWK